MPRRKADTPEGEAVAPKTAGDGDQIRGEGTLPPPGAESEPTTSAEPPREPVETVTVDETAAPAPTELGSSPAAEPPREPVETVTVDEIAAPPAPPPASEHETHEEHAEEEAGWSLAARALTGLLLLLVGAGIAIWGAPRLAPMLPHGMQPVADWLTPGRGEAEAEIAALQARLEDGLGGLDARLTGLASASDVDERVRTAVDAAQTSMAADVATLRDTVGELDGADTRQRLDRLDSALNGQTAELDALKKQLDGTTVASGQLNEEAVQRIDTYRAELQGLRAQMGTLQDKVSGLATRIDEVAAAADRQIATAQTKVGEIETQAATALGAAETGASVALVRAALASGQPFEEPLARLQGQPGFTAPEGLAAAAPSGVATLAQLRDSFPDAAHAAIRASIMASTGDGVFARSRAFLSAQMASRSLTPKTGMAPDAVLSRMEDRLRHDDLAGALAESAQLPSEAVAAMSGWLDAARLRLGAVDGLAALDAARPATN